MTLEAKNKQAVQGQLYVRLMAFGNGNLDALYDKSDGFYRRKILLKAKERPKDRKDDKYLSEKTRTNMEEFCAYLSIGETKARELLHDPANGFTGRIGYRLYAHKGKVDRWLLKQ